MFSEYVDGLREIAEATFEDTFTAYGLPEWTTVDGLEQEARLPQYDTLGKVSGRSLQGDTNTRTVTIGDVERPVIEGGLHIPLTSGIRQDGQFVPAEIGWEFELIAAGPATDQALIGRRWRVVDVPAKSLATARRLDVVEV